MASGITNVRFASTFHYGYKSIRHPGHYAWSGSHPKSKAAFQVRISPYFDGFERCIVTEEVYQKKFRRKR